MGVSFPLSARLSYWLRLTVAAAASLRYIFRLLRQGDRNAKTLVRCEETLGNQRLSFMRKHARVVAVPLRHYAAVLKAIPEIAGADAEGYRRRLHATYERVQDLASELSNGRSFLPSPSARRLQRLLVPVVFEEFFSIRIKPGQAISFAFYAESSELIRDFLDFCRHNNQFGSKDGLLAALPVFEQLVKGYFWAEPNDHKHGPQPGELCQKSLPAWARVRLHDNWFRPGQTLISLYWSSIEMKEILDHAGLPASAYEWCEQHFTACAESRSETLLGVLAFEMHQRACFDLVRTAIQFRQLSPGRTNAPSEVAGLVTHFLAELEVGLRRTTGQKSRKPFL